MATHSSTLAWKIPWTEEPSRLQSMGSGRVGQDWATSLSLFTFMHWRRKWQPTLVFLPGESQGRQRLVGCRLWGRTELDTTEESWAPKNWRFWTVVLENTLESPLDCKEIQPVHSKGDQPWVFFGRNDAKVETPVLWLPHGKCWLVGNTLTLGGIGGRWRRGRQRMR